MKNSSTALFFTLLITNASIPALAQNNADQAPNASATLTQEQRAAMRWVSDDIITYLRTGPGDNYRLVGTINAGAQIELLQTDSAAGYAQIKDENQRIGWLPLDEMSKTQSFRQRVGSLEKTLAITAKSLSEAETKLASNTDYATQLNKQKTSLNRLVTQQLETIASLNEQIEEQARSNSMQWFTRGAILGVSALIIGYIMGVLGRKRRSSGRLM